MLHIAEVDLGALVDNLESLISQTPGGVAALDVRADACGLGIAAVARCATRVGIPALLVSASQLDQVRATVGTDIRVEVEPHGLTVLPSDAAYGFVAGSRAVLSVRAVVVASKSLAAGDGVSYGHTFVAPGDTHTALIAIGYGEGLDRCAGGRAWVRLAGANYPLIGRIAMNAAVVDTGDSTIAVGTWATLFGDPERGEPAIGAFAQSIGRSAAEVAVTFGNHLPRHYGGEN